VLFGIAFGLISGFSFMIPISECNKYFPQKKIYVNGFILMGTGIGPLVFGEFSYNFINPEMLPYRNGYYVGTPELEAIAMRVPTCIRWLSLFYLLLGVVGCLFLYKVCKENRKMNKMVNQTHHDAPSIAKI
jgi:hypothetical protein